MSIFDEAVTLAKELAPHTIAVRHTIHTHPELAFHEFETSALVRRELERIGIPYEESPVKPGLIATIDSGKTGKLVLLRADMDALPIQENTGLAFASQTPGVMHACGHDVHTSNLLTVGEILFRLKSKWQGKVKLVFQPAEENGGGGREMIKAGLMDELPDACFALHVKPLPKGRCVVGTGSVSAYTDSYQVRIHGKAAHSSTPENGVDAISIAAAIINNLNMMMAKNISPMTPATLNYGTIQGGSAPNIVADSVEMSLMLRNADAKTRDVMLQGIERLCKGTAAMMGGSCELFFRKGYDSVYNQPELTQFAIQTLQEQAGRIFDAMTSDGKPPADFLETGGHGNLAGEDFGFYSQKAPSCFIWVGTGESEDLHNPQFQADDTAITICTRVMTLLALQYLFRV